MKTEILNFLHDIGRNHVISGLFLSSWIRVDKKLLGKLFESLPSEVTEVTIGHLRFHRMEDGIYFEASTSDAYGVMIDTMSDI